MTNIPKEEIRQVVKSPWNFFVRHPRVTSIAILIILIWGFSSLFKLPQETQPEIDFPIASVITVYPGANPLDVEELVTNEIEGAVGRVEDVTDMTSTSGSGISTVILQFESGVDIDEVVNDVKSAVDLVKDQLPEEAQDPIVSSFEANSQPVIIFSLLSELSEKEIKDIAEDVRDELERISGISDVNIIGAQNKQILVELNPAILDRYGIGISDINAAIQGANINFPIGEITTDDVNYAIRIESAVESSNELAQIPIKQFFNEDGSVQTIVLSDVASLKEELQEKNTIARVGLVEEGTLRNAVSLQVYKKKGGNIVKVADSAKEALEEMKGTIIPDSVDVHIANDNSEFVREDLSVLGRNGITTIILIMVLLFVFIGSKEAIISGLSIPFAMLITFGVLYLCGQTLNTLTLFSLVFALGLLIDNAVIMIEGIYENLRTGEYTPFGAAIAGIYQFKWPIIAGTLTTVFAFLPILTVGGIMGEFMSIIPITVTTVLLASLFVNLSITPTLSARFLKAGKHRELFKPLQNWYRNFITDIINSKFKQFAAIAIMTVVMIVSFTLPITGILKSESFPTSDFDFFYVDIETPPGTSLEETEKVTSKVEEMLFDFPEVKHFTTSIGTNAGSSFRDVITISRSITNIATITVNLVDETEREKKSYEVSEEIRERISNTQGGTVMITDLQGGPPSGAPIQVEIKGPDLDTLEELTLDIASRLKGIKGSLDVDTSIEQGAGEFNLKLDRDKLNFYGIAPSQVAGLLRSALAGVEASELRKNGEDINIIVEYKFPEFNNSSKEMTLDDLLDTEITSPVAGAIPVRSLVSVDFQQNLTGISHLDEERVMYVTSYAKDRTSTDIIAELQKELKESPIPKGYSLDYGGELEEITESFIDLGNALLVGILLIAILLVLQFKSYSQPFIIMLSLPFALTGVFFGLTAMGLTISIPSVIGIVGLAGVVVNDAIVLIDQMNHNRRRGMPLKEAIIDGAVSRLQPVFLTSATSIFGILPLALTDEVWGSLGFAFIFGLTTQFFLVLLLDPILYGMLSKKTRFKDPEIFADSGGNAQSPL